jgi:hypothetical protein
MPVDCGTCLRSALRIASSPSPGGLPAFRDHLPRSHSSRTESLWSQASPCSSHLLPFHHPICLVRCPHSHNLMGLLEASLGIGPGVKASSQPT